MGAIINRLIKKVFLVAFIIFLPIGSYAQNAVSIVKGLRRIKASTRICRTAVTGIDNFHVANQAFKSHHEYTYIRLKTTPVGVEPACVALQVEREILSHQLQDPKTIFGPYTYVRAVSSVAQNNTFVHKKYLDQWKEINKSKGYNGVHHIVTKATIERIYKDLVEQGKIDGKKIGVSSLQLNAPSMLHPMHGVPEYSKVFHNVDEQYAIYKEHGMRALIVHQIKRINEVNMKIGLEPMPEWYIDGILKETHFWCTHFGINFD